MYLYEPLTGTGFRRRPDGWDADGMAGSIYAADPRTNARCQADERRLRHIVPPSSRDLVRVEPRYLANRGSHILLHRAAYAGYVRMKAAAEADGIPPNLLTIVSGYRDIERQRALWENALRRYGDPAIARKWVAPPGGSAHNTGRAIDLWLGARNDSANVPALRTTLAYRWLVCNAARFGFFPYANEPWHWEFNPAGFAATSARLSAPQSSLAGPGPGPAGISEAQRVQNSIRQGIRDVSRLTDLVFQARHPERRGQRLQPNEHSLIREWLDIRDRLVRPALQAPSTGRPPATPAVPRKSPSRDSHPAHALSVAGRLLHGMPGVTIQQLIEKWRQQIAPEIPMAVLLAFIEFESGGDFDNATHGKAYRDKRGVLHRSPDFYEIGLFQTPAGKYGQCSGTGELWHKHTWSCTYNPPGLEVPHNSSEWHKLCRNILADPRDWLNPVTQVRVGLQNLKDGANGRLRRHRHLFPTLGSDWYLRMAVLMPFAGGGGYTDGVLSKHATQLAMLPENRRWDFLRGKIKPDYEHNVDAKMALAARLGYRL